jgi:hypothetical protein
MPIISAFYGIMIRMFYKEHEPAHFHAEHGGQHCVHADLTTPRSERRGRSTSKSPRPDRAGILGVHTAFA